MNITEQMMEQETILKNEKIKEHMNKTEKLKKFKIDLLLRVNSTILANIGMDSTDKEVSFAKKLRKENLKKIKEIDPEFFNMIDDNEV